MGTLSVFAQAGYLTLVQRSSENKHSTLEMIHINSYNTLPFFLGMSLVMSEPTKILQSESIHSECLLNIPAPTSLHLPQISLQISASISHSRG